MIRQLTKQPVATPVALWSVVRAGRVAAAITRSESRHGCAAVQRVPTPLGAQRSGSDTAPHALDICELLANGSRRRLDMRAGHILDARLSSAAPAAWRQRTQAQSTRTVTLASCPPPPGLCVRTASRQQGQGAGTLEQRFCAPSGLWPRSAVQAHRAGPCVRAPVPARRPCARLLLITRERLRPAPAGDGGPGPCPVLWYQRWLDIRCKALVAAVTGTVGLVSQKRRVLGWMCARKIYTAPNRVDTWTPRLAVECRRDVGVRAARCMRGYPVRRRGTDPFVRRAPSLPTSLCTPISSAPRSSTVCCRYAGLPVLEPASRSVRIIKASGARMGTCRALHRRQLRAARGGRQPVAQRARQHDSCHPCPQPRSTRSRALCRPPTLAPTRLECTRTASLLLQQQPQAARGAATCTPGGTQRNGARGGSAPRRRAARGA